MPIPVPLIKALSDGHLVPFVGSGVSRAVWPLFPTWEGLLELMAQRLEDQEAKRDEANAVRHFINKGRLLDAAAEALSELGKAAFRDVPRDRFLVPPPLDPPGRHVAGRLHSDIRQTVSVHRVWSPSAVGRLRAAPSVVRSPTPGTSARSWRGS